MAAPVPSRGRAKKMSPPRKGIHNVAASKIGGHEQQSADDGNGEQDEEDYHHRHRAHAKNERASRRSLEASGGSPQRSRGENSQEHSRTDKQGGQDQPSDHIRENFQCRAVIVIESHPGSLDAMDLGVGMVRSATVPYVDPPGDLRPFLQVEVPEPGLDVAIHGSVNTDVSEPRLHVTIYGTVDLDVSKPGVDVALYTSLD